MTRYLLPAPPEDIAQEAALLCVGGTQDAGQSQLAPAQRPECLLVLACLSGACVLHTSGGIFSLEEGTLFAAGVGPGPLFLAATRPAHCIWALLSGALPLRWAKSGEALPQRRHSPAEGMLRALHRTAELGGALDGFWGSAQAYGLLMKLRAQAAQAAAPVPALVEEAAELIRADFAYLGGVEDLADRLGVSKSHLIRRFTQQLGISPGKYLTEVRMEYAKLLLQSGLYGLETVADLVGISGANYFCKLFKAHTGLTPGAYAKTAPRAAPAPADEPDPRFFL